MSSVSARNDDPARRAAEAAAKSWDSDAIARSADRTRRELNQTLEALEAKLSPRQMLHRTVARVRDRTRGVAGAVGQTAQEHPMLVGICAVALFSLLGYALLRQSATPKKLRWR